MDVLKASQIAQALYHAHGDKAEVEAAQSENRFREAGDQREARNWRMIRSRIRRLRGANQS